MQVNAKRLFLRPSAICALALAVFSIAAIVFYPRHSLTHDASWYLISAQMFLDGAELYTDLVEINPPLAFYLTIPAIGLSRMLTEDATTAYFHYCIALGVFSSLWIARLLQSAELPVRQHYALFGTVLIIFFVLPISEFGQREHLMLLFSMPFLLYLALGDRLGLLSRRHQAMLGLWAAFGLMLKPYFLLIPASIVIARALSRKSCRGFFDPGIVALGLAVVVYLAFIVLRHPVYIAQIVPMARLVYSAYGTPPMQVWLRPELLATGVLALVVWRFRRSLDPVLVALCGGCVGAATAYLLQYKGWNYHLLPLSALLLMTASWLAVNCLRRSINDRFVVGALLLAVALLTLGTQLMHGPYESRSTQVFKRFVKRENTRILVLSTNVSAAFPFVNEVSGKWTSRFPAQWLIPGAYIRLKRGMCDTDGTQCDDLKRILVYARHAVIEDIHRFEPELIFVDRRAAKSYFAGVPFDYLSFLSEDRGFPRLRACYRHIGQTLTYDVWSRTCRARS